MLSLIIELKFADRLSYVNSFLPYDNRFSVPLVVFVLLNFNLIKVMKYPLIVLLVIQYIPAFVRLAPMLLALFFKFSSKSKNKPIWKSPLWNIFLIFINSVGWGCVYSNLQNQETISNIQSQVEVFSISNSFCSSKSDLSSIKTHKVL